jgi:hypothetical protein
MDSVSRGLANLYLAGVIYLITLSKKDPVVAETSTRRV